MKLNPTSSTFKPKLGLSEDCRVLRFGLLRVQELRTSGFRVWVMGFSMCGAFGVILL